MKHIINKCILLVLLSLCSFMVFAQTLQGSLRKGTNGGEVDLYFLPTYTNSTQYFTNIVATFTIPTSSATAKTTLTCISSNLAAITAADFNLGIVANNTVGSETAFTCTGNNSGTTVTPFTSGTEFKVATFRFNDSTMKTTPVKLADFTSQTGGTNQWGYFYVTSNVLGKVSPALSTQMFYASGGAAESSIGTNGSDGYAVTGPTVLLPVRLIDFTASKGSQTCTVDLSWQVASESNLKNYEVERSATGNGLNYSTISTVSALNVSNYSSQDASPLNGLNYYRLKMVDNDGKFNYSRIALISNNCTNGIAVEAWPNPATDLVNITGLTGKNNLVMLDANGRQVATYTTTGVNQKIKLGGFARGNYTIMVTSANGTVTTLKLVKL